MDDFSTAKPGQKLWSLMEGEVERLIWSQANELVNHALTIPRMIDPRLVYALNKSGELCAWCPDGRPAQVRHAVTPDLYWSRPEIIAPPTPVEMVEREWVGWVNVYLPGTMSMHKSKQRADVFGSPERIGPAERVVIRRMVPREG